MSTIARADSSPAWPALMGVQVLVLIALAGVAWRSGAPAPEVGTPVQSRLEAIDVQAASAAVESAIVQARDGSAVMDADVLRVSSFLSLTARGADLQVADVRFRPLERQDVRGVQIVEAVLDVSGHLFDLPIFLDGAHRQAALGRLKSMSFDVSPGGQMTGQVRLSYYRPRAMDTSWIADRLALSAPRAVGLAPVLERAALLAAWRAFTSSQSRRQERAQGARGRAARELPANLIELHAAGGRFVWDADVGIVIR